MYEMRERTKCVPQMSYVEALAPVWVLETEPRGGDSVERRLLGWVPIQSSGCPCKKRTSRRQTPDMDAQRPDQGRPEREGRLLPKDRGLWRNHTCQHLGLGLRPPEPGTNRALRSSRPACGAWSWPPEPMERGCEVFHKRDGCLEIHARLLGHRGAWGPQCHPLISG